jgi:putative hydrolase of the HAD superfamily
MDKNKFLELIGPYDNIIFDYGGVLVDIDYQLSVDGLKELSLDTQFADSYHKSHQVEFFDHFETGDITSENFISQLQKEYNIPASMMANIPDAWCKMLLDIPRERVEFLTELKKSKKLYMLSNINEIHEKFIQAYINERPELSQIYENFEKVYFSHHIGRRKPHVETFEFVLQDLGIDAKKTIFIDDSIQHIEGAAKAGMATHHLNPPNSFVLKL